MFKRRARDDTFDFVSQMDASWIGVEMQLLCMAIRRLPTPLVETYDQNRGLPNGWLKWLVLKIWMVLSDEQVNQELPFFIGNDK